MTAHSLPLTHDTSVAHPVGGSRGHEAWLSWGGDLDIASAPVLASALDVLADLGLRTVVLDVSAVAFMDCAGLSALLEADRRLAGGLQLARPSRAVTRLLGLVDVPGRLATSDAGSPTASVPDTVVTIEQSKGLIMAGYRCTADQAAKILLSTALRHNVQVQVLAALLVTVTSADLGHPYGGQARAVRRLMASPDTA